MLSAFKLENNRLLRLEFEEGEKLSDSLWVDLVEPGEQDRLQVQNELGQILATRPELDDIEASARFLKMKTGYTFTRFSTLKTRKTMQATQQLHLLFVMVVSIHCESGSSLRFDCIVCVLVIRH